MNVGMAVFGVITLILTAFVVIYYSYLFKNTDHDVSFFLSVGILSFFMNMCSNAGSAWTLNYIYLIVDLIFIGVGFLINLESTLNFYKSIGPWFKKTFTDTANIGWEILSLLVCPAGLSLYFVWYKDDGKNALACRCGKCGMWGVLIWVVLLWMILGFAL